MPPGYAVRAVADEPAGREQPGAADPAVPTRSARTMRRPASSARCTALLERELGASRRHRLKRPHPRCAGGDGRARPTTATIAAFVEAGSAAVSAGAVEAGVRSLRTAVRLADQARRTRLRIPPG